MRKFIIMFANNGSVVGVDWTEIVITSFMFVANEHLHITSGAYNVICLLDEDIVRGCRTLNDDEDAYRIL